MKIKIINFKKYKKKLLIFLFILLVILIIYLSLISHKPKLNFEIYTKDCIYEIDERCIMNHTYYDEINLIPEGIGRLFNEKYKKTKNNLDLDWLETNCECWDWGCKKSNSCNLADKEAYCTQYRCKELNLGKKIYYVDVIRKK